MSALKCIVAGALAGLAGAGIWAAVGYFLNMEIGWIAWGVGVLVGVAVAATTDGAGGKSAGAIAAAIALAAVLVGKYWAVDLAVDSAVTEIQGDPALERQVVVSYIAHGVVDEYRRQGERVRWPRGVDAETAFEPEEFPDGVWDDAEARWEAMPPVEQGDYRDRVLRTVTRGATESGFIATFSLFDLLWFALAVGTAFQLGSGGAEKKEAS